MMKREPNRARRWFLILLAGLLSLGLFACPKEESSKPLAPQTKPLFLLVTKVIDGDTIELTDGTRVRYIGIDTPETKDPRKPVEYFGKEASEMNRKLVEGKEVRLEYDVEKIQTKGKGRDRTLAYVYLGDGTFVNAWLVKYGFAKVMTVKPNVKYKDLFLELERSARENQLGRWQE